VRARRLVPEEDLRLLEALPSDRWATNGVPAIEEVIAREEAAAAVRTVLGDLLQPDGLRPSPLGPGWSTDVDSHVTVLPHADRLLAAGWLPLDGLLRRLRRPGQHRWAIVSDDRILSGLDLDLDRPPDPVQAVLDRCRRRGEVRAREVLELRVLHRRGAALPAGDPVVALAADLEAGLGGSELRRWWTGAARPCPSPIEVAGRARWRRRLGRLRDRLRPRLVVSVSGVDGAGKSTAAAHLVDALRRAGVPATRIWARPGMEMRGFERLRRRIKRRLGESGASGMSRRAVDPEVELRSRSGVIGWGWSMLVTLAFLLDVRRQHRDARGVVVYDRHLADALVTLELLYGGASLQLQRGLLRWLLPRAQTAFYLDVPAGVAVARGQDDMFSEEAIVRQIAGYRVELAGTVESLDGREAGSALVAQMLRRLL
jgi:hypothetical protein